MARQQRPSTPYDPDRLRDPTTQTDFSPNEIRSSPADLDNEMQPDMQLREGPASNTRLALIAVGIAVILGIVFYGLNSSSIHQASTVPGPATSQNSASTTPRANGQPGTTTGTAPIRPQTNSPASTQPGGTNSNNANPGNAPANK
jgi:hypothetical protein